VSEVVVGRGGEAVYLVMEWADHDLAGLVAAMPRRFGIADVKAVVRQLAGGLAYLHARWVLHRDVKPANILYTSSGSVKMADFGLARPYGSPLRPYTRPVVTLYYRAPELLLGAATYSTPIDVWSLGCVMGELLAGRGRILFEARASGRGGPAAGELAQLAAITRVLGPIDEGAWPGCSSLPGLAALRYGSPGTGLRSLFPAPAGPGADAGVRLSEAGLALLAGMLAYDPARRLTAAQVCEHPWFAEYPPPTPAGLMPTYPSTQAGGGGG
jgi:cell division cycle 2-like protein